jgi:hypothetical protein
MDRRLLLALVCLVSLASSQAARAQTAQDSSDIRRTVLDYVDGFLEGDSTKHIRSIRPEVYKYGFALTGNPVKYTGMQMTWPAFHSLTGRVKSGAVTLGQNPKRIELLDVQDQTAAAKLTASWGTDYLLLGKYDGRWMISHVLWQSVRQPSK